MKKNSRFKTVMFCVWVVVAMLLVQLGVSIGGAIPMVIVSFIEAAGDADKYMSIYTEKVMNSGYVTTLTAVSTVISLIVASIWYYNGYYKKKKAEGKTESFRSKLNDKYMIGTILVGIVGIYSLAVLLQGVAGKLMPNMNQYFNTVMSLSVGGSELLGVLVAVFLAPINEEIVMRGIVIERAKRSFGLIGCIVISALLFGFYHMNPIQGLYVLPMGAFWGYLAYRYNSVLIPVIGHMANNLLGVLVGEYIDFDKMWWILLIIVIVTFSAIVVLIRKDQGEKVTSGEAVFAEPIAEENVNLEGDN